MRLVDTAWLWAVALASFAAQAQPAPEPPTLETRATWLPSCPNETPPKSEEGSQPKSALPAALIAVVGPKVIAGVVDAAAAALTAAASDRNTVTVGRQFDNFYAVGGEGDILSRVGCLVVTRGVFDDAAKSPAYPWTSKLRALRKSNFHMEARVAPLQGGKFFQLVPVYLRVDDFEEFSFFDPKARDYQVAVALKLPGQADAFGSADFTFRRLERGTLWPTEEPRLRLAISRPLAFPEPSADAKQAKAALDALLSPYLLAQDILTVPERQEGQEAAPSIYQQNGKAWNASETYCRRLQAYNAPTPREFKVDDELCTYLLEEPRAALAQAMADDHRSARRVAWAEKKCDAKSSAKTPVCAGRGSNKKLAELQKAALTQAYTFFTTDLTLTETREGSKLALLLGTALTGAKDDVTTLLAGKLLPKTQAQQEAADQAARDRRTGVLLADLNVTKAEELLAEQLAKSPPAPSDVTDARIALLNAKIAANKAYRSAGQPVPYPEVD